MKAKPNHPRTPKHLKPRQPDIRLRAQTMERRLYPDFLALAFYPGMEPTAPRAGRINAA